MRPDPKKSSTGLMIAGVGVRFGGICALDAVDFELGACNVSALIGPNGAGKSTLVNVLTGYQRRHAGTVTVDGHVLNGKSPQQIVKLGVMRTFQSPRIIPGLSVLENVMLANAASRGAGALGALAVVRKRREEDESVAEAWHALERFELTHVAQRGGAEISGGQQRLVELARMSLRSPRFLILDEPTAGVAPAMRQTMVDHLRTLQATTGARLVIVEHDMAVVEALAEEVFVLAEGKLLFRGTMAEVRSSEQVVDAYLGAELPRRRGERTHAVIGKED